MKRLLPLALLLAATAQAQTPHALGTGKTSMSVTLANQTAGATNFVFVGWCPSNCVSGSTLNSPVTITDSTGSVYTSVYRTDGPSSDQVFIAPSPTSASNVISVSIPASNSSVVMASQVPGLWTVDTAANTGDLMYAVFIGTDATNYLAGSGFTRLNAGTWWTDEFSTTSLTPTFIHNGATANPTFSVPFKVAGPPPSIVTFTFPVQLTTCTKCDGTDDQGAAALGLFAGSKISISSGSSAVCSGVLNANAQMSCSAGIDISPAMIPLSLTVVSGDGSTSYTDSQQILGILFMGRNVINVVALFDATNLQPRGLRVWSQ